MLPRVLCFLAIAAFAASAPNSNHQYIQQLQKEYEDDRYEDAQDQVTDNYGKLDDDAEQFQDHQSEDMEQFEDGDEKVFGQKEEGIFGKPTSEMKGIEQYDQGENIEQYDQNVGDKLKDMEQVDQVSGDENENIEQVEQTDDYWNQHDDIDNYAGGEIEQEQQVKDDVETESMLGKLFGNGEQELENTDESFEPTQKKESQQEKQLPEVGREYGYSQDQLPVEEVVEQEEVPLFGKQSYGSAMANENYTPEPYETEVYTKKTPWYKRFWGKTKETARKFAHKVKETVGK